jgi:hypothetical protein
MSTPITLEDLQAAIEQLRPELPTLLGTDYPAFAAELDSYLHMGSINRVLELFGRYPAAHHRLLDTIEEREEETIKGGRLFGIEKIIWPYLYYRCRSGPHILVLRRVEKRDVAGQAICPQHLITMSRISSQDLRAAIERLRPELPQLLGTRYSVFETELGALLHGGSDDQISKLFDDYPAARERLLQVLV